MFLQTGNDYIWVDNLHITTRVADADAVVGTIVTRCTFNTSLNCMQIKGNNVIILDNLFERSSAGDMVERRNDSHTIICSFNEFKGDLSPNWDGSDGWSTTGGTPQGDITLNGNMDVFYNWFYDLLDDAIENDDVWTNVRTMHNMAGPHAGKQGISIGQGGPSPGQHQYVVGNQITGVWEDTGYWLTPGPPTRAFAQGIFKYRADHFGWVAQNTFIVEDGDLKQGADHISQKGNVIAWNFWTDTEGIDNSLLNDNPDYTAPAYWGQNRYDVNTNTVWNGDSLATAQAAGAETGTTIVARGSVADNMPVDEQAGTSTPILPTSGQALDGTATDTSVNGWENMTAPFLSTSRDIGAHQRLIGACFGRREFTDHAGSDVDLAFKIPSGWSKETIANVGNYTTQGLPSTLNDGRILLSRSTPTAAIVFDFYPYNIGDVWTQYDNWLAGRGGDTPTHRLHEDQSLYPIREGLGLTIATNGSNTKIYAAAVTDGGLMTMEFGAATSDVTATPSIHRAAFEAARSIWYQWGSPESGTPIVTSSPQFELCRI
jgi:hypothetical protein